MAENKGTKGGFRPLTFLREVQSEGRKVTWASTPETVQATIMVVVLSVVTAIFLFLVDQIIKTLISLIIGVG